MKPTTKTTETIPEPTETKTDPMESPPTEGDLSAGETYWRSVTSHGTEVYCGPSRKDAIATALQNGPGIVAKCKVHARVEPRETLVLTR